MKTILSLIFAFSIVAVFATVSHQSDNVKGEPIKIQSSSKTEVKKPEKANLLTCAEMMQAEIANCYGTIPSDVIVGSVGNYYIASINHFGSIISTDCGKDCTYCCISVFPSMVACCFTVSCDYP